MSKFICLSCHKEFKVSVRAPMSCPTKHLCNVVLNERDSGGTATSTTATPNDQQRISDTLRLPTAPGPIPPSYLPPSPDKMPTSRPVPPTEPEESSFALNEFVAPEPPAAPIAQSAVATEVLGALIIGDQQFPFSRSHVLGREGDLGKELFRLDKTVGRLHAKLEISPEREVAIRNLAHSGNPVVIDGSPLAFDARTVLKGGLHKIQLGTRFLCSINVVNAGKYQR